MRLNLILIAAAGIWAHAQGAHAQALDTTYEVEVLVFSHLSPAENYYRAPSAPAVDNAIDLLRFDALHQGPTLLAPDHGIELTTPKELVNTEDILDRNGAYEPLLHMAWYQQADVFGDGRQVRVYGSSVIEYEDTLFGQPAEPVYAVDGTATLEQGQFMHLTLNLVYRRPVPMQRVSAPERLTDNAARFDRDVPYQMYRIIERRRIAPGRYEYFDHAQFGVLAVVRPLDQPGEDAPIEPSNSH